MMSPETSLEAQRNTYKTNLEFESLAGGTPDFS